MNLYSYIFAFESKHEMFVGKPSILFSCKLISKIKANYCFANGKCVERADGLFADHNSRQ